MKKDINVTKADLMDFICEKFTEPDGVSVSLAKLDSCKKSMLEEFIKAKGEEENFTAWLDSKKK